MKKTVIALAACCCLSASANVPQEIQDLMEKEGTYISLQNGKATSEDGGSCKVIMNPYGGESSISIDANAYFAPVAHMDDAARSTRSGETVYELSTSGRRPGGSVCGDWDSLLRYKKLVRVNGKTVTIEQSYRCLFGGKTEIVQGCKIN